MDGGNFWRKVGTDKRGAIGVLGAFMLVAVLGSSALALEYGRALLQKVENQRVADLAAFGGALVYNSSGSTDSATGAIDNIVMLNGLPSADARVSYPAAGGNQQVQVQITAQLPLLLARVLTANTTLPVSAVAVAQINSTAPGCIIALGGAGSGVSLSGGTQITANNCAVASNSAVTLTGSATLQTKTVDYGTSYSVSGGSRIVPPSGVTAVTYSKTATADPLSGNSEVSSATSRLGTVAGITSPSAPTVSPLPTGGTAVNFGYSRTTTLPGNCSDSFASNTHTVTCTGNGPFNVASLTVGGGLTVNFNTAGSSSAVYNFSSTLSNTSGDTMAFGPGTFTVNGSITNSGTLSFGAGTFNINGAISNSSGTLTFGAGNVTATAGITTGGGTTTTFGGGTFTIGKGSGSCNSSTGYSICNTGTRLSFAGPSTFVLSGGIYNAGGSTLTLGSSGTTSNSYNIGKANDGNSIYAGGSAPTTFYDATGSVDLFQMAGNIASGGGTCMTLPAAAEHDINGSISLAGGTTLGAGIYTVTGYVAFGANGGGAVTCNGNSVGISGGGITLVIGGSTTPSSGTCAAQAFCAASGYSNVTLTAPSTGTTQSLLIVGPTSTTNTAAANFAEGATGINLSGAFYFPNGAVNLSGAATINTTGGCLELIGSQVTLSGGSTVASTCTGLGSSGAGTTVSLVQ